MVVSLAIDADPFSAHLLQYAIHHILYQYSTCTSTQSYLFVLCNRLCTDACEGRSVFSGSLHYNIIL